MADWTIHIPNWSRQARKSRCTTRRRKTQYRRLLREFDRFERQIRADVFAAVGIPPSAMDQGGRDNYANMTAAAAQVFYTPDGEPIFPPPFQP